MKSTFIDTFKSSDLLMKIGAITMVFLLIAVSNFVSINYIKTIQEKDAAVVDAAGRQRMLSQKIAFLSERAIRGQEDIKDELSSTIDLCDASLRSLKVGGAIEGIADNMVLPATPPDILPILSEAESLWAEYREHALDILKYGHGPDIINDTINDIDRVDENRKIHPGTSNSIIFIEQNAPEMLERFDILVGEYVEGNMKKQDRLNYLLVLFLFINIVFSIFILVLANRYIRLPILNIKECIGELAEGRLNNDYQHESRDELGKLVKALQRLENNLEQASAFATDIGLNRFDSFFEAKGKDDRLGNALLKMRDRLIEYNNEEDKRKWISEGVEKFSDIARRTHHDLGGLSDRILSGTVKYIGANQGGIYVVNDDDGQDIFLEMTACYAWDRKKYLDKKIYKGEGAIGEVWAEGLGLYMKNVPSDYVNITSGLGEAPPRYIYILPLIANGMVYGVMEFALFKGLGEHQKIFLEKLSEVIASTISHAKTAQRTEGLLRRTRYDAEQMKAQEEVMLQGMEELQAAQEAMKRKQKELEIANEKLEQNGEALKVAAESARQRELEIIGQYQQVQIITQQEMEKKIQELEKYKRLYEGTVDK